MNTILLVEDDRRLAAHWQQSLETEGFRVIHETSVEGAIDVLDETTVDLVVTDIVLEADDEQLSVAGGLAVISYIALNIDPQPMIIATSGLDSNSTFVDRNFKRMDSLRALRKPVEVELLLGTIRELTEQKENERGQKSSGSRQSVAEQELRDVLESNQAMLKLLGMTDGVWDWKLGSETVAYAPGFRKLLGFEGDDALGFPDTLDSFSNRIHPEDREGIWASVNKALQLRSPFVHEYRMRRKDDSYIWVRSRATTSYDENGNAVRMVGSTFDITEQKEASRRLKENSEKIRGIFDNTNTFIGLLSTEGELLEANQAALGGELERGDVIGKPYWETPGWAHSVELQQRLKKAIAKAASGEKDRIRAERPNPDSDEPEIIDVTVSPIYSDEGEIIYLLTEGIDVTAEQRAFQKLRLAEKRFREVADITAPCWITEVDTSCSWLNRQWLEYTGLPLAEQLGFGWLQVVHPGDVETTKAIYLNAAEKQLDFSLEYRLRRYDGEYRKHRVIGCAQRDENDQFNGYVGHSVDVEDEHAQVELQKLNAELNLSNKDLEQFAYAASHDLQEPLRAVSGFVQLLQRKYEEVLDEQGQGYIQNAVDGVGRMGEVIDGLLNYSRVGNENLDFKQVDLNDVMTVVRSNLAELIGRTSATLKVEAMPTIRGNGVLLNQLFQNLVGNALKYRSDQSPEIKVWYDSPGNMVRLFVKDNGIGIPEEYRKQIFGLFKRLHHRGEYPGTGLGLAIVKRIVERHEGTICVESNPEGGSCFVVELPH